MLASTPVISTVSSSSAFDALVLGHLRRAHIRARLILNSIDTAGIALRGGLIDAEGALGLIDEAGLLDFVVGRSS
jgi:hypothetical protein